jgi:hypothetical protein
MNTGPSLHVPCLLGAHTRFLSVYAISAVNIVAGPRGLVIVLIDCPLEGASSSVQLPTSADEARLPPLAQGGWYGLVWGRVSLCWLTWLSCVESY